ncbi:MAG: EamA family transporter [Geothrix sp.]|nr:EamA family transporter [Geothrix sp.]
MPITGIGLAFTLVGALSWALFDALRKRLAREVSPIHLGLLLPLAQAPLLALWAATREPFGLPAACLPPLAASAVLNGIALVLFLEALRLSPMSLTIPLLSFTPVISTTLAWIFRGQAPGSAQYAGAALVVLGAVVLGLGGGAWRGLAVSVREPGVRRMALVALLWGGTSVLDQTAVTLGAGAWYAPVVTAAVAVLMLLWAVLRGQVRSFLQAVRPLASRPLLVGTAVVIGAAALAVQIEAFRWAPIGFIEVVKRGAGMASAVILGRFVFGEPLNGQKALAVALLTLGVALVVGLR